MKKILSVLLLFAPGIFLGPASSLASSITVHNNTGLSIVKYEYSQARRALWLGPAPREAGAVLSVAAVAETMNPFVPPLVLRPGESFVLNVPDNFKLFDLRISFTDNSIQEYISLKNNELSNIRLNPDEAVMF